MPTAKQPKPVARPEGRHGPQNDRWLIVHGWKRAIGPMDGNPWDMWIPPETTAKYHDATRRFTNHISFSEDELLRLALLWHHLKRRELVPKTRSYGLAVCLRGLLKDLEQTGEILRDINTLDQTEALRSFDLKGIRGDTRRLLERARSRHLSQQAAREPDPLAS